MLQPVKRLPGRMRVTLREMRAGYMAYLFIAPFMICFAIFVVGPVVSATLLAFTSYDSVQAPHFIGFDNFIKMLTKDVVLMKYVIPNTLVFAVVVGPVGYVLQFLLAFFIIQAPRRLKKPYIMAIYTPSIAGGVLVSVVWAVFFSGDRLGYLNDFLLKLGSIPAPVAWTQEKEYLLLIMILVTLWGSMGVGFLAMLAGVLNVNEELYEAAYIDGVKNRFQEIIYVTIPSMRPQMLFGAVMAIVGTFNSGSVGVSLSGSNPTPNYAGQVIVNHIEDYGFIRYEMGYAAAVSVVLLLIIWGASKLSNKLFADV
jgi:multiple sugar transport system permease protein